MPINPITDEELERVASNLERLRDYFEARTDWWVSREAAPSLVDLHGSLVEVARNAVQPLMRRSRVEIPTDAEENSADQRPSDELQIKRLQRFESYNKQLKEYFAARARGSLSEHGRELIGAVYRDLFATITAIESILGQHGINFASFRRPKTRTSTVDHRREVIYAKPVEEVGLSLDTQLVLEESESEPLLQTSFGKMELTDGTKKKVQAFLAEVGVSYDPSRMIQFQNKVQAWIRNSPSKHILVIKVSELSGEPRPYPTYAKKAERLGQPIVSPLKAGTPQSKPDDSGSR